MQNCTKLDVKGDREQILANTIDRGVSVYGVCHKGQAIVRNVPLVTREHVRDLAELLRYLYLTFPSIIDRHFLKNKGGFKS